MNLPFRSVADPAATALLREWRTQLQTGLKVPFLGGTVLPNTTLASGIDTAIEHKLGKVPQGWMVLSLRAASDVVIREPIPTFPNVSRTDKRLTLRASGDCTFDLLVW